MQAVQWQAVAAATVATAEVKAPMAHLAAEVLLLEAEAAEAATMRVRRRGETMWRAGELATQSTAPLPVLKAAQELQQVRGSATAAAATGKPAALACRNTKGRRVVGAVWHTAPLASDERQKNRGTGPSPTRALNRARRAQQQD